MKQLIRTMSPNGTRCMLHQYIGAAITFFCFSFYLSVSILSAISVSQSLHFPHHLHLPRHLHPPPPRHPLPISISSLSLSPISLHYTEKHKIFITGANNVLRFTYPWGHRLKIVVYLAKTEIH